MLQLSVFYYSNYYTNYSTLIKSVSFLCLRFKLTFSLELQFLLNHVKTFRMIFIIHLLHRSLLFIIDVF
jgi:hypothetical protein